MMEYECKNKLINKELLRFGNDCNIGPFINVKSPYVFTFLGAYENKKSLVLVGYKFEKEMPNFFNTAEKVLCLLLPIFNALSFLHEYGICHTNISKENIVPINGLYRLTEVGENYLYNSKKLNGNEDDVKDYNMFFTKKKDYVKLKDVVNEILPKNNELKKEIEKIFKEIESCKKEEELDGLEILKKHIKCEFRLTIKTILNNDEWYKLAYYKDPVIEMSVSEFIGNMKEIKEDDKEKKYFLSECFLNYILSVKPYNNNSSRSDENSDFEQLKEYFYEIIKEKENEKGEIDENMKEKEIENTFTVSQMLNNKNTKKLCLQNKLHFSSDYEAAVFAILLTYYHDVEVLRIGKNYFDDLATRNIVKGLKYYTSLKELNMKMSHFSYISLKALSEILKNNTNLEKLNLRCTREYDINYLHIKKWDTGLKLVIDSCSNSSNKLKKLSLRSNDLKREGLTNGILNGIANLTNLEILNLRYNNLGEVMKYQSDNESKSLMNSKEPVNSTVGEEEEEGEILNRILSRLRKLKKLDLRLNCMSTLFTKMLNCYKLFNNLEVLYISDNLMNHKEVNLGKCIEKLIQLKEIHVDNNKLDDLGVYNLFKVLMDDENNQILQNLEKISLNRVNMTVIGLYHFSYFVRQHVNIKYLSLNGNNINPEREDSKNGITFYSALYYLKELVNLEYLDISKNLLGKKGAANLSFFLRESKSLKYLNISKTSIASEGLFLLINGMKKSCKNLEEIVLNDILLDMNGAIFIEQLFKDHPSIKKIDFSFNGFTLEGNNLIINTFSNKDTLEKLILKGEVLTSGEITTLSAYIKNNTNLKIINLDYSKFNDSCMKDFSSSFIYLSKLEELSLENCYIMTDAIESLCEGLTNLTQLKVLNLSKNSIDNNGILKLCKCFSSITKLEKLDLSGNNLLQEGVISLCDNLYNLPFLHELNLIGNNCGQEATNYLLQTVKNNKRIDIHENLDIMSVVYKEDNIKKTVFLIKGEDRGKKAWYYVAVNSNKIADFLTALGSPTLTLDVYGTIVNSAYGIDPAPAARLEIRQTYPFLY